MTERGRPREFSPKEAAKRKQNISVYLGTPEKRIERWDRLQVLADEYADGKVSKLVQMIADGELDVSPVS